MRAPAVRCLVVCLLSTAALAGSVQAKTRPQTGNGIEAVGSAAWPAVAAQLAKNIAKRIENELKYPGRIKVTIIREMRVVEYAR